MPENYTVVHYLNQFFARIGGEDAASAGIEVRQGALGPGEALGAALSEAFGKEVTIAATICCGDNHLAENLETVTQEILEIVRECKPDLFFAGPAYAAGRYGVGCGALCAAVKEELGIPAVTAMSANNPGADIYRKDLFILETGDTARTMKDDVRRMAVLARKLLRGETPDESDGCFVRGWSRLVPSPKRSSERAIDMLLKKLKGEPFASEVLMPHKDDVPPAPPVPDLSGATVVMITDGGLYPEGNPDRIPPQNPNVFGAYPVDTLESLPAGGYMISHNGYDPTFALADPNRLIPLDAMRSLEKAGKIGKVHDHYLSTTGLVTTVANSTKIGREMAAYIRDHGIDAAILTST